MKKGLIKAGVLLLLFVGTAAGTLWYINRGTTQETREMEEPTLPVLYMEVEGTLVNPMYGGTVYSRQPDTAVYGKSADDDRGAYGK